MIVSIDLPKDQVAFLEMLQSTGAYPSRSEAIRDTIRRMQFDWSHKRGIALAKKEGWSEDIEDDRQAAFELLGRKYQ